MSDVIVVFSKDGARIVKGDSSQYAGRADVLINPDLENVRRLPPHLWGLADGKVVPLEQSKPLPKRRIRLTWPLVGGLTILVHLCLRLLGV